MKNFKLNKKKIFFRNNKILLNFYKYNYKTVNLWNDLNDFVNLSLKEKSKNTKSSLDLFKDRYGL